MGEEGNPFIIRLPSQNNNILILRNDRDFLLTVYYLFSVRVVVLRPVSIIYKNNLGFETLWCAQWKHFHVTLIKIILHKVGGEEQDGVVAIAAACWLLPLFSVCNMQIYKWLALTDRSKPNKTNRGGYPHPGPVVHLHPFTPKLITFHLLSKSREARFTLFNHIMKNFSFH